MRPDAARDIDRYQAAYSSSEFEPVQAAMRKRMLLERLGGRCFDAVLEVGCGDDGLFNHWPHCCDWWVVEPGAHFASQARQHAACMPHVHVVEALMEEARAALPRRCFDLILLSGLVHEVPSPEALLAAVRPYCAAHTLVHVNVPNARSFHRLLACEMGLIDDPHALSERQRALQQPRTFDLDSLAALCRDGGFEVTDSGSYFVKPFTHAQMAQLQRVGLLDERMLRGLCGMARHLPGLGSEIFVHLQVAA